MAKRKGERTCALDLGKARVGVAIDDELGMMAHARPFIPAADREGFFAALLEFLKEEEVGRVIVGLPVHMNGEERRSAKDVRAMAQEIADRSGLEIELWDERWSTTGALRSLRASDVNAKKAKTKVDSASAVLILEGWLASRNGGAR